MDWLRLGRVRRGAAGFRFGGFGAGWFRLRLADRGRSGGFLDQAGSSRGWRDAGCGGLGFARCGFRWLRRGAERWRRAAGFAARRLRLWCWLSLGSCRLNLQNGGWRCVWLAGCWAGWRSRFRGGCSRCRRRLGAAGCCGAGFGGGAGRVRW